MSYAIQFYENKILFGDKNGLNTDKIAFSPDCCCEETIDCFHCTDNTGPRCFQIDIAGIINDTCPDNKCTEFNGQFIIDLRDVTTVHCDWHYEISTTRCNWGTEWSLVLDLQYHPTEPNPYQLFVYWCGPGVDEAYVIACFYKEYETKPSCMTWNQEDVPYSHNSDKFNWCDPTSATCKVTAL